MYISSRRERSSQHRCRVLISSCSAIFLCLFGFFIFATTLFAETDSGAIAGLAWLVRGTWRVDGKGAPICTGDAIQPGSLLQPGGVTPSHSIIVFLADGRRIFYECVTPKDCARGFRVPSLYRIPDPVAVDMLARIHATLALENKSSGIRPEPGLPREEVVAVLGPDNRVSVGGLAAELPNGRYTYDLRRLNGAHPTQFHIAIKKTGPAIIFPLPGPGIYDLTIADDLNAQRIDLFVAAIKPARAAEFKNSFHQAAALMEQWNDSGFDWPIHDFQRAYLESLMQDALQRTNDGQPVAARHVPSNPGTTREFIRDKTAAGETHRDGVTAEPMLFPKPGVFDGDTAVVLRSATPGSTIHFTVDNSEPMADSPIYIAPIMVKGTGLTIKSFASAPGRKDSAVVTGIYRSIDNGGAGRRGRRPNELMGLSARHAPQWRGGAALHEELSDLLRPDPRWASATCLEK
jgi:hypothetical protein